MSARRGRIAPVLMEALQMLKFTLKHGGNLDFMRRMKNTDEIYDLGEAQDSVPEDIIGYLASLVVDSDE
jgi:hypothetical protein